MTEANLPDSAEANEIELEVSELAPAADTYVPPNMAGKKELVKLARDFIVNKKTGYVAQAQRDKQKDTLDLTDKMLRISQEKSTVYSSQQANTISNQSSTGYRRRINQVSAGEQGLLFDGDELPAKYVPPPESIADGGIDPYYTERADAYDLLALYTFNKDQRQEKIEDLLFWTNGYANYFIEVGWSRRVQRVRVREIANPEDPVEDQRYEWGWKEQVLTDNPCLTLIDVKDILLDWQIVDMCDQVCVIKSDNVSIEECRAMVLGGDYDKKAVDMLAAGDTYKNNEEDAPEIESDRQINAGATSEASETGLFRRYTVWAKLPIDEDRMDSRSDKTLWDVNKYATNIFKLIFVGNSLGDAHCVLFERNRMPIDEIPLKDCHSHRDNKGMLHDGYATQSGCLYETETTLWDMLIDNVHLGVKRPWIAQLGQVITTDLKFRDGNQVIYTQAFAGPDALRQAEVMDMTHIILPALEVLERNWDKLFHVQDMMSGELRGARTTATESKGAFSQAIKPALSKARYTVNTFMPWLMKQDAAMWDYFGDKDRIRMILGKDMPEEIAPDDIRGPLDVRVTAIDKFESDVMKLAEEDQFLQVIWPIYAPLGGRPGQITWLKKILKRRKYDINGLFPNENTADAQRVADSENTAILEGGVEDYPAPGENHEVHLRSHEAQFNIYKLLPKEQIDPRNMQLMQIHIEIHRQLQAAESAANAQSAAGTPAEGQTGGPGQLEPATGAVAGAPQGAGDAAGDVGGALAGGAVV